MDDRAIARWRLHSLHLAGQSYSSAPEVVRGLLGVQAENHPQASWAVADRTTGMSEDDFARCFDAGEILRTHVLRTTWHFVTPDDIRWLLDLSAPRLLRIIQSHQNELGVDDAAMDRALGVITQVLAEGVHLTRKQLGERLAEAGLPLSGRALGLVVMQAELSGLICSGVRQGRDHTYALLEERAPGARRLDEEEALAEIALRYFTSHGPATELDLAYWATLSRTEVRTGLSAVADRLERFEHDGRIYWFGQEPPASDALEPRGHLLQLLDEYYRGYQDSRYVLDADGLLTKGREPQIGMALVDGQMVAGMRRTVAKRSVRFDLHPLRRLRPEEITMLEEAAQRYGRFLGLPPRLVLGEADT